jgi:hypothetical protein
MIFGRGDPGDPSAEREPLARAQRGLRAATPVRLIDWIRARDADLIALRRAARAAIVMPGLFALSVKVIGDPTVAAFAAFGAFSQLLLASFTGPMADRVRAQLALALAGAALVVLGTLVSTVDWLAAITTAVVAFGALFAGVVSSVLASATTALLFAFILPVSLAGSAATVPDRLAGWGMAAGAALLAITLLWPSPTRDGVRASAIEACRSLAARLRAHVAHVLGGDAAAPELEVACTRANEATAGLRRIFYATPYRPTGLTTATRVLVRLVDEVGWLNSIVVQASGRKPQSPIDPSVCAVNSAAATVLERGAEILNTSGGDPEPLRAALGSLREAIVELERRATIELPPACRSSPERDGGRFDELISALDPAFRAQELSFVVSLIGENIAAVAAAERRSWLARALGREPAQRARSLAAAQERAASHIDRGSVWLHNSLRGGVALGLAVLIASLTGAQHSFWVVLGALSVLRSNAFSTGQNAVRGLAGTVAGFAVGGVLVTLIGTNTVVLWLLLAPAVLLAGFAPAAISFAAGQGAFTVTLVILYNIIQPAGWRVGLVRIEDVALGCAVSLLVGILFWPRGAAAALGDSLAEAYAACARYLSAAVAFGMGRCDAGSPVTSAPQDEATAAAAAARRLDDTFRTYLAERGAKSIPLAETTGLVTGVAGLRLAADAVLELWRSDDCVSGDRAAAREELIASAALVTDWYTEFAAGLTGVSEVPDPLGRAGLIDRRLFEALDRDLSGEDHRASATAVRMIWTGDHLDAARRLQHVLVRAAREIARRRAATPPNSIAGSRLRRFLGTGAPLDGETQPADRDAVAEAT